MLLSISPVTTFAAQSNEYVDPADNWLSSNNRTNELDVNATTTYETQFCCVCNMQTTVLTYRVPEYTRSGETALNRDVRYSDGTCLDEERNIFVGAVVIRLSLSNDLLQRGGHISDGIRPSERNKGYGTKLVSLAIKKCNELGINEVLMVCDKNNIYSSKTIIKNNGKLENEIQIGNKVIQRHRINQGDKND